MSPRKSAKAYLQSNLRPVLQAWGEAQDPPLNYAEAVRAVAKKSGVTPRHIYAIANGNKRPSRELERVLAQILGCRPEDISILVFSPGEQSEIHKPNQAA